MEDPEFSLSTRPRAARHTPDGIGVEVGPSVRGWATIHDKDVPICCIRQLTAALNPEVRKTARARVPGHDAYALVAEWQIRCGYIGRPRPARPDRAFLDWVVKRIGRGD